MDCNNVFENYIPLGWGCYITMDLQSLGLRDASYPFDWVSSSFFGVLEVIQNHFTDYLNYKYLYQDYKYHHVYRNIKYDITFYHDFKKELPLFFQIAKVKRKYKRRIERFYKEINNPTLFMRYIRDEDELNYISKNHSKVLEILTSFNSKNRIIYITDVEGFSNEKYAIPNIYYVKKDSDYILNRSPIKSNVQLYDYLKNVNYKYRDINLEYEKEKKNKKPHVTYRIERYICKALKDYKHYRQMKIE